MERQPAQNDVMDELSPICITRQPHQLLHIRSHDFCLR